MKTKVSDKYQVVIPKAVREKADIREGQTLYVYLAGDAVVFTPVRKWPDGQALDLQDVWEGVDVAKYLGDEREAWR